MGDYIEESCSECNGRGKRLKLSYICLLIRNEIIRLNNSRNIKDLHIKINESYENEIKENILGFY